MQAQSLNTTHVLRCRITQGRRVLPGGRGPSGAFRASRFVLIAAAIALAAACGDDGEADESSMGDGGSAVESTGEGESQATTEEGDPSAAPSEGSSAGGPGVGTSAVTSGADETSSPATDTTSSPSDPSSTAASTVTSTAPSTVVSTGTSSDEMSGAATSGETTSWFDDSTSSTSPGVNSSDTHDSSTSGTTSELSTGYGSSGDGGTDPLNCGSGCAIDGECVAEGTPNGNDGCEVCRGSEDDTGWSPLCSSLELCQEIDGTPACGCPVGFTGEACDRCLIYVDEAQGDAEADGRSWENAVSSLNVALTLANSGDCEVWVAQGTYIPTTNSVEPRDATFAVPAGVDLYGGFAGDEWLREQRSVEQHETILTGDLEQNDDVELLTSFDDNAYHVVSVISEGPRRLDGFTITAGHSDYFGGGLILDGAEAYVSQCTFRGNLGTRGAAVAATFSTATFEDCWFEGNISDQLGGGLFVSGGEARVSESTFLLNEAYQDGGGISGLGGAELHVTDSVFDDNEASYRGGALNLANASGEVTGCFFRENEVGLSGGAIDIYGPTASLSVADSRFERNQAEVSGAVGVTSLTNSTVIVRSEFTDNYAVSGSAAVGLDGVTLATIANCGFVDNTSESSGGALLLTQNGEAHVYNSVFLGNQAAGYGGAILTSTASLSVFSSSFSNNASLFSGGAIAVLSGSLNLHNSISWDNTAPQHAEVFATNASISYSDIEGWCILNENCDDGNINADPLFVSSTDLRLQATSPARDSGSNAQLPTDALDLDADQDVAEVLPLDYALSPRVSGAGVDMGAYEAAAP